MEYHRRAFEKIAVALDGYTKTTVISFIDLYSKVKRNFPEAREVTKEQRLALGKEMIKIASAHGMTLKPCAEGDDPASLFLIGHYEKDDVINDVQQKSWIIGDLI